MNKFWMVYSPQGSTPVHRHHSSKSAWDEATRLAGISPNKDFIVLEAKHYIKGTIHVEEHPLGKPEKSQVKYEDGIPF